MVVEAAMFFFAGMIVVEFGEKVEGVVRCVYLSFDELQWQRSDEAIGQRPKKWERQRKPNRQQQCLGCSGMWLVVVALRVVVVLRVCVGA
mmetsp:Transcript_30861/g.74580  ORF Transcript_30861/g.74580 Transcript_30861/m.74580 type:complete len:90 (-) Transcript_30861:235-504(-)